MTESIVISFSPLALSHPVLPIALRDRAFVPIMRQFGFRYREYMGL